MATKQDQQLRRVSGNIGKSIVGFFQMYEPGTRFLIDTIVSHVRLRADCAPSSVDRVMRQLRQQGVIDYKCVDRSSSYYEIVRKP